MNEFNNYDNEPNFNFKRIRFILICVVILFFIFTIAVFQLSKNKNYNLAKQELTQNTNTWKTEQEIEDEYYLSVIRELQQTNEYIPALEQEMKELEAKIRRYRLSRRCLEYEMERIQTNKWFIIWYCDNPDNLEQFTNQKQIEVQQARVEPKVETVVF